jgi:hypothetical protein
MRHSVAYGTRRGAFYLQTRTDGVDFSFSAGCVGDDLKEQSPLPRVGRSGPTAVLVRPDADRRVRYLGRSHLVQLGAQNPSLATGRERGFVVLFQVTTPTLAAGHRRPRCSAFGTVISPPSPAAVSPRRLRRVLVLNTLGAASPERSAGFTCAPRGGVGL